MNSNQSNQNMNNRYVPNPSPAVVTVSNVQNPIDALLSNPFEDEVLNESWLEKAFSDTATQSQIQAEQQKNTAEFIQKSLLQIANTNKICLDCSKPDPQVNLSS